MNKNKITSYFVFVSFLTFVAIFFSIVEKSYFNLKKPQKLVENNALLKEFNPNLDLSVISTIESKNKNTEESFDFSIIKSADTENSIRPTVEPTIEPATEPTIEPTIETSITPNLESTNSSSSEVPTL
ncbi:MAG: hypothetical protein PHH12_01580 [Candidatus Shapirobacteria bacterium]|nr:hypothetical protein [Candidatus Shapirobacteria bacterium]